MVKNVECVSQTQRYSVYFYYTYLFFYRSIIAALVLITCFSLRCGRDIMNQMIQLNFVTLANKNNKITADDASDL